MMGEGRDQGVIPLLLDDLFRCVIGWLEAALWRSLLTAGRDSHGAGALSGFEPSGAASSSC